MFVQVIQGQCPSRARFARLERWEREVAPGRGGMAGVSTSGVTEDGRLIALARFESEEAAPQQQRPAAADEWWSETSKLFTGEPVTFRDSSDRRSR